MSEGEDRQELETLAASLRGHLDRLAALGVTHVATPALGSPAAVVPVPAREPAGAGEGGAHGAVAAAELAVIRDDLGDCQRCKLAPSRRNIVFGVGDPRAALVFVGEAPGAWEDQKGEPFVGDAGKLLDRMIAAMGYRRGRVYIANIIKCRPPGNRNPERDEIDACEPFLKRQLAAIRPRMIVALGKFAAQTLLDKPGAPISALRGRFHQYEGVQVMPTYHPAFLLRSPQQKRKVWEDLQKVMAELDRLGIRPPFPAAATS